MTYTTIFVGATPNRGGRTVPIAFFSCLSEADDRLAIGAVVAFICRNIYQYVCCVLFCFVVLEGPSTLLLFGSH